VDNFKTPECILCYVLNPLEWNVSGYQGIPMLQPQYKYTSF